MEGVELADFIKSTLVAVAKGVRDANDAMAQPEIDTTRYFALRRTGDAKAAGVSFDIALSATRGQKDKSGFMVAIAAVGGGANSQRESAAEAAHRIRFDVALAYEIV